MTLHPGRGSFRAGHEAQAEARCHRFKNGDSFVFEHAGAVGRVCKTEKGWLGEFRLGNLHLKLVCEFPSREETFIEMRYRVQQLSHVPSLRPR